MIKVCAVILLLSVTLSHAYIQEIILHKSIHQNETHFLFRENVPNVPTGLLDSCEAYCTKGFWLAYDGINYEGTSKNLHGYTAEWDCHNEKFPYKSFRFGGDRDTSNPGLTIYPQEGYQGTAITVTGEALAILTGKSVLYTGQDTWTIYEGQNFFGNTACVKMDENYVELGIHGHTNVSSSLGLSIVGSVLKGCTKEELKQSMAEYLAHNLY